MKKSRVVRAVFGIMFSFMAAYMLVSERSNVTLGPAETAVLILMFGLGLLLAFFNFSEWWKKKKQAGMTKKRLARWIIGIWIAAAAVIVFIAVCDQVGIQAEEVVSSIFFFAMGLLIALPEKFSEPFQWIKERWENRRETIQEIGILRFIVKVLFDIVAAVLIFGGILNSYLIIKQSGFSALILIPVIFFLAPGLLIMCKQPILKGLEKKSGYQDDRAETYDNTSEYVPLDETKDIFGRVISGIPLSRGTVCVMNLIGKSFDIYGGDMCFSINFGKLDNMRVLSEEDMQRFLINHMGGDLAAPVLAAARETVQVFPESVNGYFLVTYFSETGMQYLLFQCIHSYTQEIQESIEQQRKLRASRAATRVAL